METWTCSECETTWSVDHGTCPVDGASQASAAPVVEPKPKPKPTAEPKPKSKPKPKSTSKSSAEPKPKAKPKATVEAGAKPKPKPKPKPTVEPGSKPTGRPQPDAGISSSEAMPEVSRIRTRMGDRSTGRPSSTPAPTRPAAAPSKVPVAKPPRSEPAATRPTPAAAKDLTRPKAEAVPEAAERSVAVLLVIGLIIAVIAYAVQPFAGVAVSAVVLVVAAVARRRS